MININNKYQVSSFIFIFLYVNHFRPLEFSLSYFCLLLIFLFLFVFFHYAANYHCMAKGTLSGMLRESSVQQFFSTFTCKVCYQKERGQYKLTSIERLVKIEAFFPKLMLVLYLSY